MKTQMRFQKIIFLLMLVLSALTIFYAFSFCTGAIAYMGENGTIKNYSSSNINTLFGGQDNYDAMIVLYEKAQSYTNILMWLGIAFILLVVVCYIFACSKRRNYYLSNYITAGILVVYAIVWAIVAIALSSTIHSGVLNDAAWVYFGNYYGGLSERMQSMYLYSNSIWIYQVGYVLAALVILNAIALTLSCVWKFMLMKGEKKLLANGLVKEVA